MSPNHTHCYYPPVGVAMGVGGFLLGTPTEVFINCIVYV